MPKPRKQQISLDATPYYHCVSRCVRRAFLCGTDTTTGQSYEHRRGWLEEKLLILPQTFAIDIAAYAIMSNHYHVVLHIDKKQADEWTDIEVVERWHSLFKGNLFSQKFLKGESLDSAQRSNKQRNKQDSLNKKKHLGFFALNFTVKIFHRGVGSRCRNLLFLYE